MIQNLEKLPIVALVGRPNVGKSTLFNRLIDQRKSIETPYPGTTRDSLYSRVNWQGRDFVLVDTAGLLPKGRDKLADLADRVAKITAEKADLVLFIIDLREGLVEKDYQIAKILRRHNKKVILVVNKSESSFRNFNKSQFKRLGFEKITPISAISGQNCGDLLDEIVKEIPTVGKSIADDSGIGVAIIGRPNVGKSTLFNSIINKHKMIVSTIPGTTRDAEDSMVIYRDQNIRLIDTAGLRKKSTIEKDTVESFSLIRSLKAIKDSKVLIYLISAEDKLVSHDINMINQILEQGVSLILVVNKIDMIKGERRDNYIAKSLQHLQSKLNFIPFVPAVYISAKEKIYIKELLDQVVKIYKARKTPCDEGEIEEIFKKSIQKHPQISYFNSFKYLKSDPPVFKLKTHKSKKPHFSHLRYLENKIRDIYPFFGTPIFIDWEKE